MYQPVSRHTPFNPALVAPIAHPLCFRAALASAKPAPTVTRYMIDKARQALTYWAITRAHKLAREVGFSYEPVDTGNPETFEDVQVEFRDCSMNRRAFKVWAGASDNTIYTCPEGNFAFRFIHDVTHAVYGFDFSPAGELACSVAHVREVSKCFGADSLEAKLMDIDTRGQLDYFTETLGFIEHQLNFAYAQLCTD